MTKRDLINASGGAIAGVFVGLIFLFCIAFGAPTVWHKLNFWWYMLGWIAFGAIYTVIKLRE